MSRARNSSNSLAMTAPRVCSSCRVFAAWNAMTSTSQVATTLGITSSATVGAFVAWARAA